MLSAGRVPLVMTVNFGNNVPKFTGCWQIDCVKLIDSLSSCQTESMAAYYCI